MHKCTGKTIDHVPFNMTIDYLYIVNKLLLIIRQKKKYICRYLLRTHKLHIYIIIMECRYSIIPTSLVVHAAWYVFMKSKSRQFIITFILNILLLSSNRQGQINYAEWLEFWYKSLRTFKASTIFIIVYIQVIFHFKTLSSDFQNKIVRFNRLSNKPSAYLPLIIIIFYYDIV